ncbi:MAG: hypothetical protein IJ881_10530, partial [Neisseriaceae bacterium]|nr:hypothetical protein [Neisseriaceae bacterium]
IMCRKSEAWKYEQEYRAILEQNYLPIEIKKITLGKGFFLDTKSSNSREAQQDFENHILKIASFIYQVLKDNKKYSSEMPEFYRYQDKYSQELIKIETNELENYIAKHTEFIIT